MTQTVKKHAGIQTHICRIGQTLSVTLPHRPPKEPHVPGCSSVLWSQICSRRKTASFFFFLQLCILRTQGKELDWQTQLSFDARADRSLIHKIQFFWDTNPRASKIKKWGNRASDWVLVTCGFTVQSCLANPLWLQGHKVAWIHLGVPHGPRHGLGYRRVFQHPSVPGRGFWVLTSAWLRPHPDLHNYEQPAKEPSSSSPRARAPGFLFHPLSYVSTMSNSENENEKRRLTDLSCPHGLENLGKGLTCLCPLWGHVRRKPL